MGCQEDSAQSMRRPGSLALGVDQLLVTRTPQHWTKNAHELRETVHIHGVRGMCTNSLAHSVYGPGSLALGVGQQPVTRTPVWEAAKSRP